MSIVYHQAQKQKYRITLELDVMDDFDPHNINWDELFDLLSACDSGREIELILDAISELY